MCIPCHRRGRNPFFYDDVLTLPQPIRVALHATHEGALKDVSLADLKKFAAEPEASNASTRAIEPGSRSGLLATHHSEISGHTGGERAKDAVEGQLTTGSRGFNS